MMTSLKERLSGLAKRMLPAKAFTASLAMVIVVALGFSSGYNSMVSYNNACQAQVTAAPVTVVGGMCACCKGCVTPCEVSGTASLVRQAIYNAFYAQLVATSVFLENWLAQHVDGMVQNLLEKVNDIEKKMIDWWSTMWYYNLSPGLRAMTVQMNTANSDLNKTYQASMDAEHETQTNSVVMRAETQTARVVRDNVCPPAGLTGGAGRAKTFSRATRGAWQRKASNTGANVMGEEGAGGQSAYLRYRTSAYETAFCDPNANGGGNVCGTTPAPAEFYNADTEITKFVYNKLTINIDDATATTVIGPDGNPMTTGQVYERAIRENMENLIGSTAVDPVAEAVMVGPAGIEVLMKRRDYLAKYNALRSVPQYVFSQRMPGSQLGQWIEELRTEAGVPVDDISENPSYREVLNALTVDRFNSGKFANSLQKEQAGVEMEKLAIGTFYLMLLRDYHDLLERQALSLAVQVGMMADDVQLPSLEMTRSMKQ